MQPFSELKISCRWLIIVAILGNLLSSPPTRLLAKDNVNCQPILDALDAAIDPSICQTVKQDFACYGSAKIQTELRNPKLAFSKPSDQVQITDLRKLETKEPSGAAIIYANTNGAPVKIVLLGNTNLLPKEAKGASVYTLRKASDKLLCDKTPSGMMLQTRKGETGQVTINDVVIRLGSTVFISFDATDRLFTLSQNDRSTITALMKEWDQIHHRAIQDVSINDLDQVLTGSALAQQIDAVNTLQKNRCYWTVDEVKPGQILSIEPVGQNQAKAYMIKNWDMDIICRGKFNEATSSDGDFIANYVVELVNGQWRISEKSAYDIVDGAKPPAVPVAGKLDIMTVTNVEGNVQVTALGETITLLPGQQVRIALANDQPVDISGASESNSIPQSSVINWLTTNPEGLPSVNATNLVSSPTTEENTLIGYYTQQEVVDLIGVSHVCDRLVVTGGNQALIDEYLNLVEMGNSVNSKNELGQLVFGIEISELSQVEIDEIRTSTINSLITLTIRQKQELGRGAPACFSYVEIVNVTSTS